MAENIQSMEDKLRISKLKMKITKAEAAKQELDLKILENQLQIQRMLDHKDLQDIEIKKAKEDLKNLE